MEHYIGIDLGTTNSAICTYDKETLQTRVWKSPEQSDVTPSAIYFDRHERKFIGQKAYDAVPRRPDSCARLFKRFMGTSIPIELSSVNRTLSAEECSAEILKTLFGYLPEEIRNSPDIGTVITVPAAFNQMKKNATLKAAEMAGIGSVELVQEPVAAVLSFMKTYKTDGIFLIYDLGGGTLDITVAESIRRRVDLLAHGGIELCGGRDFDRVLVDNLVCPWLHDNFDLPDDIVTSPQFKSLLSLATWATEQAKIELSARNEATINLYEDEIRMNDLNGDEIYLDIPLQREFYNDLIADRVNDTIQAARETLSRTGYTANDVECIVWVGGPTHYKPLRDKVSSELGIKGDISDVDPMTAVAEGASIFAESIRWKDEQGQEDQEDQEPQAADIIIFNAIDRTPDDTSKIAVRVEGQAPVDYKFQIVGLDDGSDSGSLTLTHGEVVTVNLTKPGNNTFKASVYDATGKLIQENEVVITKVDVSPGRVPSELSIALEVLGRIGGEPELEYLVTEGDLLPKNGDTTVRAGELLEAGSGNSLNFKLRQKDAMGNQSDVGLLQIEGKDLPEGSSIPINTDLKCFYEKTLGGNIKFSVEVDVAGTVMVFDDVYYFEEGFTPAASQVIEKGLHIQKRIEHIEEFIDDELKLEQARRKVELSTMLDPEEPDMEKVLEANQANSEADRLLKQMEEYPENRRNIRQSDLNNAVGFFDNYIRQHARPAEETAFDNLTETAQRSIDNNDNDFADHLDELRGRNFEILWRQDWFVIEEFNHLANSPHLFADQDRFEQLVHIGNQLMEHPEIQEILAGRRKATIRSEAVDQLRGIVAQIMSIPRTGGAADHDAMQSMITNILAG